MAMPHPLDADLPTSPVKTPLPYIVVQYPTPENVPAYRETFARPQIHIAAIDAAAARQQDTLADRFVQVFRQCDLDARRSHKVEGVPGHAFEKWTIYIDLGTSKPCN
jgi:hypothetical protein